MNGDLPPSSSVSFLPLPAVCFADDAAHFGRAGERDLRDAFVLHQRRARLARAGDDVDHARRHAGFLAELREVERRERGELGGLQHDGVAHRDRGRDFPRQHQQRKIPRDHRADDADGW